MIPKHLHFIWLNFKEPGKNVDPPEKYLRNVNLWTKQNPDFNVYVWQDSDCLRLIQTSFPVYLDLYRSVRNRILMVDMLRVCILLHIGGAYVDMDTECYKGLNALWKDNKHQVIVLPRKYKCFRNNCFIASVPDHPFLQNYLKSMGFHLKLLTRTLGASGHIATMWSTGPVRFGLIPTDETVGELEDYKTYMQHKADGTWTFQKSFMLNDLVYLIGFGLGVWSSLALIRRILGTI